MRATTRRDAMAAIVGPLALHPRVTSAAFLILLVAAPWAWWATQLWGLPDIGDPFDVAAFEAEKVPDDRNAYLEYRQATSMAHGIWKRFQAAHPDLARVDVFDWAKAEKPVRDLLDEEREALRIWRVGSEKPDARQEHPEGLSFHTILEVNQKLRLMVRLAILEGSRLEAEGDMAGAWGWYRAVFRSSRHSGRHGFLIERGIGAALHKQACDPLRRWATDPRVDAPLLRRALDELIAVDAMTPPFSGVLKMEYLVFRNSLNDSRLVEDLLLNPDPWEKKDWCDQLPVSASAKVPIQSARLLVADDRERSLRVLRLMLANWLAQADKLPSKRLEPASRDPLIYRRDPEAPPAWNPLEPEALARWVDSSLLARRISSFQTHFSQPINRERPRQAKLVVHLADQLYRREHEGQAPPSPKALVGPYLKALPEGFDAIEEPAEVKKP